jgi:hypothetical protein
LLNFDPNWRLMPPGKIAAGVIPELAVLIKRVAGQLGNRLITRALLWHHWQVTLEPDRHLVWAGFLNSVGLQLFSPFFAGTANARVRENLGEGTFIYEGVQGTDTPEMSLWMFDTYGGMKLNVDLPTPNNECSIVGALTASREFMTKFLSLLEQDSESAKR